MLVSERTMLSLEGGGDTFKVVLIRIAPIGRLLCLAWCETLVFTLQTIVKLVALQKCGSSLRPEVMVPHKRRVSVAA